MYESDNEWPRSPTTEWLSYRLRDYHRRLQLVEDRDEKYDPKLFDLLLKQLATEVKSVKRALYGLMFVIVAGSVTFAFTVFALLGQHP